MQSYETTILSCFDVGYRKFIEKGIIMPKLKTNKSAAKRFKITKTGKLKKRSAKRGHILGKMTRKAKRNLRKSSYVSDVDAKKIRRLLPYG